MNYNYVYDDEKINLNLMGKYKDNSRFVFKKYTDRGHDVLKCNGGILDTLLIDEVIEFLDRNNQR